MLSSLEKMLVSWDLVEVNHNESKTIFSLSSCHRWTNKIPQPALSLSFLKSCYEQ